MLGLGILSTTKKRTKAPKAKTRTLKRGKFYWHRDNSIKKQHPSLVFKTNKKKNKYHAVCFTHTNDRIKLNKNINPKDSGPCYALKKVAVDDASKFGSEIKNRKVEDARDKSIVRKIKRGT